MKEKLQKVNIRDFQEEWNEPLSEEEEPDVGNEDERARAIRENALRLRLEGERSTATAIYGFPVHLTEESTEQLSKKMKVK